MPTVPTYPGRARNAREPEMTMAIRTSSAPDFAAEGGPPWMPAALTADDDTLRAAIAHANLPTLQAVIAQLTGDNGWLRGRFRPSRTVATDDNDTSGLEPAIQRELREAAQAILCEVRDGDREILPPPEPSKLVDLVSQSLGEEVPRVYGTTMAEEAGFRPRSGVAWTDGRPPNADELSVLVIGAGSSGIGLGASLEGLGIPYTIVERQHAVGGVWQANTYPGAGVDTPTNLYSFSFFPNPDWRRYYASQAEVRNYLERAAESFNVARHIRFGLEATRTTWIEREQRWKVELRHDDGSPEILYAAVVVSCVGILTRPHTPDLPGMDEFAGPMFHSSDWPTDLEVDGRRVAVIGTGATAMQIVPAIADSAARVTVFQRTPAWIVPNSNYLREIDDGTKLLMAQVPYYASFYRLRLIWMFQDKLLATLRRDPDWPHQDRSINSINEKHRLFMTKYVEDELGHRPDLMAKVLPSYPPYGKRILMDNNWYRTLRRDDVELVADAVVGFDSDHVETASGLHVPADVVVLATGFYANRMLWPMEVVGRGGRSLRSEWGEEDASAYLGVATPGFPNFFLINGPNTQLGHGGSAIYVNECSTSYVVQLLIAMAERSLGAVEVRHDVAEEYNQRVDAEHAELIWTHPAVKTWYKNAAGRVTATTPWRGVDYWKMTRQPDLNDFLASPRWSTDSQGGACNRKGEWLQEGEASTM